MNITDSIAKQIGGDIEVLINENPQIQFYANGSTDSYQWRDSRFASTSDAWRNLQIDTRRELINDFLNHIKAVS
jgi:hypothetical protein